VRSALETGAARQQGRAWVARARGVPPTQTIHTASDSGKGGSAHACVARDGDYNKSEEDQPRAAKCYIRQGRRTQIAVH